MYPAVNTANVLSTFTADQREQLKELKVAVFSCSQFVRDFMQTPLTSVCPKSRLIEVPLTAETAPLAMNADVVNIFVNDTCNREVVKLLAEQGTKLIAMRCAGFDRVDVEALAEHGMRLVRVPTYSPQSVAEHAVALMFALNRHLIKSYQRVVQGNYALSGLVGFEMFNKTVGVVGTGAIGVEACRILKGIGCRVIAYDIAPNPKVTAMGIDYMTLDQMLPQCDIVTLHCPLLPSTRYLINRGRLSIMKKGAMLINVSRGGLVESAALFDALESGQLGSLGLDTYENEGSLFFKDFTIYDDTQRMKTWDRQFKALTTYPQVLVTPHSAFLTYEALDNIAATTLSNIKAWRVGEELGGNEVKPSKPAPAPPPAAISMASQ